MDNGPAHRNQNAADWQKGEGEKKELQKEPSATAVSCSLLPFKYF